MDSRRKKEIDEHIAHCERQRQWLASLSPEDRRKENEKARKQQIDFEKWQHVEYAKGFLDNLKKRFEEMNKDVSGKLLAKAKEGEATVIHWLLTGNNEWPKEVTDTHKNLFRHWLNIRTLRDAYSRVSKGEEPELPFREQSWPYAQAWAYGKYLAWLQGSDDKAKKSQPEAKTFEELFYDPDKVKPCIDVLNQLGKGPIINDRNEYVGSSQKKSILSVWFEELTAKGLVSDPGSKTVARLASAYFPGLKASEKVFRGNVETQAADDVRTELQALLANI